MHYPKWILVIVILVTMTGCQRATKVITAPAPVPCQEPAGYQCQPVNNDAALQRIADVLTADPTMSVAGQRAILGIELCSISLVLTGVEVPAEDNPLTQRIRRIEDAGIIGTGPAIDPDALTCPTTVRGAPKVAPVRPVIGCVFTDGSQCQPVNNGAALKRIADRLDNNPPNTKAAILVEEACAIDRVTAGIYDSGFVTPLAQRWDELAKQYQPISNGDLATAQNDKCPGLHHRIAA